MAIHCLRCKHYFSTFDSSLPRGCRLYNFKTAQIPAVIVKNESGQECQGYEKRKTPKEEANTKDLNDPKLWG